MSNEMKKTDLSERGEPARPARLRLNGNTVLGIGVAVLAAGAYLLTFTFDRVPSALAQGMQPAAYPRFLLLVALGLAGLLVVKGLLERDDNAPNFQPPARLTVITALILVAAVIAMPNIGVIATMFAVCAAIPPLWGQRRWTIVAVYAVVFPMCIYGLFAGLLEVRFPVALIQTFF